MKIMIVGSMAFAKKMVAVKKKLERLGHNVRVPFGIEDYLKDESFVERLEDNLLYAIEKDILRKCYKQVAESDAILVLNYKRNGIDGYIGTSVLMEMAIAYYLNKKIFVFNDIPHFNTVRWAHEVTIMQPDVLKGDLSKIK